MTPLLASIIGGRTFWIAQKTLGRLTLFVFSNSSGSNAVNGVNPPVRPALANRPSIGPKCPAAATSPA
jgi:hypothetical protein